MRPELVNDLAHACFEESHAGVESRIEDRKVAIENRHTTIKCGESGVHRPHHLAQRLEPTGGYFRLVPKAGAQLADKTDHILNGTLNGTQRCFDRSQALASVVVHPGQRNANAYRRRQRFVFELRP